MIRLYALIAAILVGAGGVYYVMHLRSQNADLTASMTEANIRIATCALTLRQASEDRIRDDAIDNLDNDALRAAARKWMLEAGSGTASP